MSKNKTINELHRLTGVSFKECRRVLNCCQWDYETAYCILIIRNIDFSVDFSAVFDRMKDAAAAACDTLADFSAALSNAFRNTANVFRG